jgi:hypothetical protein
MRLPLKTALQICINSLILVALLSNILEILSPFDPISLAKDSKFFFDELDRSNAIG